MSVLAAAKYYGKLGFSTIPVNMIRHGQKVRKPAIVRWEPYQEKLPTEEELKRFFDNGAHIAIITGKLSNLLVLDIDSEETHNEIEHLLPPTVTVLTPGGGWHYYFRYTDEFYTIARIDKAGLDIRAEGGYVVAPPSTYPEGAPYKFADERGFSDIKIAVLPEKLKEYIKSFGTMRQEKSDRRKESAASWFDKAIQGVDSGNRNDMAIRLAGYFHHYKIPPAQIQAIMVQWNKKNTPPLEDSELNTLLTQFFRRKLDEQVDEVVTELNKNHAVVRVGNSVAIMEKFINDMAEQDFRIMKQTDFTLLYRNRTININRRSVPISNIWLDSDQRKEYQGIIFDPDNKDPDYYNLWTGLSRKPQKGDWSLFREHIEDIIAPGYSDWLIAWMARVVQDPGGIRPGTVPVLRGEQGTGKSLFVSIFGELFGKHYTTISSVKGITRQFTHYLKDNVLLFLDEGIWGGDKQSAGALKSIITEPWRMTEPKGFEAFRIKNHINLIIASNEEWIVPGGIGERRFLVLDVRNHRKGDYDYFRKMATQMYNQGGIEAMMHDLLRVNVKDVNLREIPRTEGTRDQILHSLSMIGSFWLSRLEKCTLVDSHDYWKRVVSTQKLYDQYADFVRSRYAHRNIAQQSQFGRELRSYCPAMTTLRKRHAEGRYYVYGLPSLPECRSAFDQALGVDYNWMEPVEISPPRQESDRDEDLPGSHRRVEIF